MKNSFKIFLFLILFYGCSENESSDSFFYYPPNSNEEWEKLSFEQLNWDKSAVTPLKDFLIEKNTKSFMILVNGRIVMEEYFDGHTSSSQWQWNSAGKTLTSAIIGIAQQENLLNINNKVSDYLGTEWTNTSIEKENLIKIFHLLTMTSGLNDEKEWVIKQNLTYLADAGSRWSYHNVFQKLMDVVSVASGQSFENYFANKIKNKIGMDGLWNKGPVFTIYYSNTRSMARFGLLALRNGKWKNEQIINQDFFIQCINSSQFINPSYGYFWWLNGKNNYMLPSSQNIFNGTLIPNAPEDLFAAMGKDDQRIYVVPSKNMVIVRMGNSSESMSESNALLGFDNLLWEKINDLTN